MSGSELQRLVRALGEALVSRGWLLAVAESCTGGELAAAVTSLPGSSRWFERGFVTYSNAAKHELLAVNAATLLRQGAVSEAVAAEMVAGALRHSHAQLAAAISGVAGPDGGTADKPVGTVCFAWQATGHPLVTETRRFDGDRSQVRAQAVRHALEGLLVHALPT